MFESVWCIYVHVYQPYDIGFYVAPNVVTIYAVTIYLVTIYVVTIL